MPGLDPLKPTMVKVQEVRVHDGKGGGVEVRMRDQVELLRPNNKSMLEYLGPGPYTIEWLGRWRCGRGFLQLKTKEKGRGKGVNASELKAAS